MTRIGQELGLPSRSRELKLSRHDATLFRFASQSDGSRRPGSTWAS
jgi:hypothetical protein